MSLERAVRRVLDGQGHVAVLDGLRPRLARSRSSLSWSGTGTSRPAPRRCRALHAWARTAGLETRSLLLLVRCSTTWRTPPRCPCSCRTSRWPCCDRPGWRRRGRSRQGAARRRTCPSPSRCRRRSAGRRCTASGDGRRACRPGTRCGPLFLPGDRTLRNGAVLEPVGQPVETLRGLRGVHVRLAVVAEDGAAGAVAPPRRSSRSGPRTCRTVRRSSRCRRCHR